MWIKGSTYPDQPDPGGWVPVRCGLWPPAGRKVRVIRTSELRGFGGPDPPPRGMRPGPVRVPGEPAPVHRQPTIYHRVPYLRSSARVSSEPPPLPTPPPAVTTAIVKESVQPRAREVSPAPPPPLLPNFVSWDFVFSFLKSNRRWIGDVSQVPTDTAPPPSPTTGSRRRDF